MPQFTGHLNTIPINGQTSIENFHLEKAHRAFMLICVKGRD